MNDRKGVFWKTKHLQHLRITRTPTIRSKLTPTSHTFGIYGFSRNTRITVGADLSRTPPIYQPSQASPDDQNHEDSQQIDQVNTSQVTKETALQKSNTEVARPAKSNKLSYKESREIGRQQMNKTITKYAETARRLGKKKKYEV